MAISGHRSESVFERYNSDTDDDLREAVEKVASYVNALPTTPASPAASSSSFPAPRTST
jgi:hypothetical protein